MKHPKLEKRKGIFFIGLPCSGKSTFIKNNFSDFLDKIISADQIKLTYKFKDYKIPSYLWHEQSVQDAKKQLFDTVDKGQDFIFDGGGINDKYSKSLIDYVLSSKKYKITIIYLNVPLSVCLRRLSERDRKVPIENVIEKSLEINKVFENVYMPLLENKDVTLKTYNYYSNKNFVFDLDGTLCEYDPLPLGHKHFPKTSDYMPNYVKTNRFLYLKPVNVVINKIKELIKENNVEELYNGKTNIYVLSVSNNSMIAKDKINWINKHLPFINQKNIIFSGSNERKYETLIHLMERDKIEKNDITVVDDVHSFIWECLNKEINAIHISKFINS